MDKKPKKKRPQGTGGTAQRTKNEAAKRTALKGGSITFSQSYDEAYDRPAVSAGLRLNAAEARNAMILSEIIGPPVSKRRKKR